MDPDRARALTAWLPDSFFPAFVDVAESHHIDPTELAAVLWSESHIDPRAPQNPPGGVVFAQGIFQVIPSTLKGLGWPAEVPIERFRDLSAVDQLGWLDAYIRKLGRGSYSSGAEYYWANFYPATMHRGLSADAVVVSADAESSSERAAYAQNWKAFDLESKGAITFGDLQRRIESVKNSDGFRAIETRLALGPASLSGPGGTVAATTATAFRAAPLFRGALAPGDGGDISESAARDAVSARATLAAPPAYALPPPPSSAATAAGAALAVPLAGTPAITRSERARARWHGYYVDTLAMVLFAVLAHLHPDHWRELVTMILVVVAGRLRPMSPSDAGSSSGLLALASPLVGLSSLVRAIARRG